jgi:hypothetical protein
MFTGGSAENYVNITTLIEFNGLFSVNNIFYLKGITLMIEVINFKPDLTENLILQCVIYGILNHYILVEKVLDSLHDILARWLIEVCGGQTGIVVLGPLENLSDFWVLRHGYEVLIVELIVASLFRSARCSDRLGGGACAKLLWLTWC